MNNLFETPTGQLSEEMTEILARGQHVRIEHITSNGNASPPGFWYDQDEHEWVAVLCGAARLEFENEMLELRPGQHVLIPAHRRHRVAWTTPDEPTVWLAVFFRD